MKSIIFIFYLSAFCLLCSINLNAQVPKKYSENLVDYREVTIDINKFKSTLLNTQLKGSVYQNRDSNTIIDLPIPKGDSQKFKVVESPILSSELSATRPEVKSYLAKGIDDPTATARFNITAAGFYGVIKSSDGITIIEKINDISSDNKYITYYDHNIVSHNTNFNCDSAETNEALTINEVEGRADSCFQIGDNLRSYELVLTCSGEFYALNGGTDALVETALLNRITQVNAVYETEIATTFTIVEFLLNNNPATDPYSDPTNTFTSITETENYINANVTASSWDIGHGFHEITCGGGCGWAGRAGLAVVCTPSKARGYTYLPNDIPTAITVLLHEFGHQFSNRHTNYGCNSNNACSRYEPGQGSTIMSTGAGCDAEDFFANRTDYFSVASLQNMTDYMNSGSFVTGTNCETVTVGGWSDCATLTPTGNNMPSSNANINNIDGLVIPHGTPFLLTGEGADADGTASLTYNWEQYDTDYLGSDAPDDTSASIMGPLFRSFPPSTSSERTVPQLSSVLAGNITTGTGEVLPSIARNLTWRLTVRDNEIGGGGVACDQINLTVGSDGPFKITSQNSITAWSAGDTETITWDVANTDSPTYTCPDIDILYSSDGGATFSTTLASGVPNNGSHDITVPGVATNLGRIKIVCTGGTNIFFDINDVDISIISSCSPVSSAIANNESVTALEGDASLNLTLLSGLPINSISGVLDDSDGNTDLSAENNGSGACISFNGNNPKFETVELASGSNSIVTFTRTNQSDYTSMIGLFEGSYNNSSVCDNWLNSNGNFNGSGINISSNFAESLSVETTYVLLASAFNSATPPNGNYNINFSETLYNISGLNAPGYLYTYVIVNTTSGNIIAFDDNSDLSNASNFPSGNYVVYGLSYLASESTSSYIGDAFSNFQSDISNTTFCGALSTNSVTVDIISSSQTYTYNLGSWSPQSPIGISDSDDQIIVETGDLNLSSDLMCDTFTVNPGASVSIDSGITLTVFNSLNLESTSSSYSSLISDGLVSGTIVYSRYVAAIVPVATNDLIAPPLSGENFADFVIQNSNLAGSGTTYLFGPYNTILGGYQNYDSITNASNILEAGIGYRAATTDGSNLAFTGTVLSTDVLDIPISDAVNGSAWNLIGNPYPSYLDFNAFFTANTAEFDTDSAYQALYGYDGTASNGWVVWNQATIDEGSITELIAPGQGFFVKSKLGGGLVDFTTSMRTTGNSDDFISGRSSNNNATLCKLNINSNSNEASTQIYFIDGTTRGLDSGYDASTYSGSGSGFSMYSHLAEDNEGLGMAIQTLPYTDLTDITIPIGINAPSGTQLQISIDEISSIPDHINVYIEDNQNNTFTLLNTSDYIFTPNTDLNGTGRFYIHFSSQSLTSNDNDLNELIIYTSSSPKGIVINGLLDSFTKAQLFDVQGRLVSNLSLNTSEINNFIDVSSFQSGIYILKVSNQKFTKAKKLIIK